MHATGSNFVTGTMGPEPVFDIPLSKLKEPTPNVPGHGLRVGGRGAGLPAGVDAVQLQAGRPGRVSGRAGRTAQVIHAARAHALLGLHGQRQEGVIWDLQ